MGWSCYPAPDGDSRDATPAAEAGRRQPEQLTAASGCFPRIRCAIGGFKREHIICENLGRGPHVLHFTEDIHSMKDLKRPNSDFVARLKETGGPIVLTANRAEVVVQDAAAYQSLLDAARNSEMREKV